jgi:hypothetical protein
MTDSEMRDAWNEGKLVAVKNHDYEFQGRIMIIFRKYQLGDHVGAGRQTGKWRCVIQNFDGLLLIQSAKNLELATTI